MPQHPTLVWRDHRLDSPRGTHDTEKSFLPTAKAQKIMATGGAQGTPTLGGLALVYPEDAEPGGRSPFNFVMDRYCVEQDYDTGEIRISPDNHEMVSEHGPITTLEQGKALAQRMCNADFESYIQGIDPERGYRFAKSGYKNGTDALPIRTEGQVRSAASALVRALIG